MNKFEEIQSMNLDEFAKWFEENCIHDADPCIKWWDETYCKNCKPEIRNGIEYGYCELNDGCRFFNHMNGLPSARETIKMWLESKVD